MNRMEQNYESGTRWSIVDDNIWEPPLWSVIVSIALGIGTEMLTLSVLNDLNLLAETHNLASESLPHGRIFCLIFLGAFAAAFAFANAVLLFRNVKVWLRKISINSSSTYKFHD